MYPMNENIVRPLIVIWFLVTLFAVQVQAQHPRPFPPPGQSGDQYLTDSTYYYLGNTFGESWFNHQVYRVTARNEANNVLTASDYEYDTLAFRWYEQRRYQGSFLNDTIRRLWQSWVLNPGNGLWLLADSIHFNIDGSPTVSWYKEWDPVERKFAGGKFSEFIYNEQGILHLTYNRYFDTISGDWIRDYYDVMHYNHHNLDSLRQVYKWDGSHWSDSLRITYIWTPKLNPESEVWELWQDGAWQNARKLEYVFTNDLVDEIYEYDWLEALEDWMYKDFTDYSYNPDHAVDTISDYLWDGSDWINKTRKTYTYNTNQQTTEVLNEYWSFSNEAWVKASLNSYIYDQHGNRKEFSFYTWDEDQNRWRNFYKEENFWVFYPSAVDEPQQPQFEIFPNPSDGIFHINPDPKIANSKKKLLMLYTSDGQLLKTRQLTDFTRPIDLSGLHPGAYHLVLKTDTAISGRILLISE